MSHTSPVARGTACERVGAANVIELLQPQPQLDLIGRRLPRHIENFVARPQIAFRISMASKTPLHLQRNDLPDQRHLVYPPMASGAADTLVDVNAVIEICEVRDFIDANPMQGLTAAEAFPYRAEIRAVPEQF